MFQRTRRVNLNSNSYEHLVHVKRLLFGKSINQLFTLLTVMFYYLHKQAGLV